MKLIRVISLVLGAGVALSAVSALAADKPKHAALTFTTGSPTASWFSVGAAISNMVNQFYEGQPVSAVPGAGGVGNPTRVATGQADIGISYAPFLKMARQGNTGGYKDPAPELRAIAGMTANKLHLVMEEGKSVDFKTLKESKRGLKIGTGQVGSGDIFVIEALLEYSGVSFDDIEKWGGKIVKVSTGNRVDAWKNRQLGIIEFFINAPDPNVTEALSGRPAYLLDIPKDVRSALGEKWGYVEYKFPANIYPNQPKDVTTIGLPFVVFASSKLDDEIVYKMTKVVAENKAKMVTAHASFETWQPEDMVNGAGIPFHNGALKYYKERGWIK